MIPCKHCNTFNSLDSTFCKRCGTGLPEAEMEAAKAKLEMLVQDGMHSLNEGRINEAMAVAETAVVADPSMVSALTLKAAVHERKGEIVEALECAERIVDLNPDSELDKIKRNQLRAALGAQALSVGPPNRAVAFLAAASVVVILVCGAMFLAHSLDRRQSEAKLTIPPNSVLAPSQAQTRTEPGQQPSVPQTSQTQTGPAQAAAPGSRGGVATPVQEPSPSIDEADDGGSAKTGAGLPATNLVATPVTPVLPPSIPRDPAPAPETGNKPTPTSSGPTVGGQDPAPTPDVKKGAPALPASDPGEIIITVHRPNGVSARPPSSEDFRDTTKMYAKMANDSFMIGNYGQAAQQFEKALSNGADPITMNERLAQAYSSLGKKDDAVTAYKRAIQACSSALNAGRGDSTKLRAVRDACETAVRQIQGS